MDDTNANVDCANKTCSSAEANEMDHSQNPSISANDEDCLMETAEDKGEEVPELRREIEHTIRLRQEIEELNKAMMTFKNYKEQAERFQTSHNLELFETGRAGNSVTARIRTNLKHTCGILNLPRRKPSIAKHVRHNLGKLLNKIGSAHKLMSEILDNAAKEPEHLHVRYADGSSNWHIKKKYCLKCLELEVKRLEAARRNHQDTECSQTK